MVPVATKKSVSSSIWSKVTDSIKFVSKFSNETPTICESSSTPPPSSILMFVIEIFEPSLALLDEPASVAVA